MWHKIYLQSVLKQGVHDHPIPSLSIKTYLLGMPHHPKSKSNINYTIGTRKGRKAWWHN